MPLVLRLPVLVAVVVVVAALAPSVAAAQARHERVTVSPMTRGGKTIGARIKLTLRPEAGRSSGKLVLGRYEQGKFNEANYRDVVVDPKGGYFVHGLYEFSNVMMATELNLELEYGKGNTFAGGEKLELASVWNGAAAHVWGMTRSGLPGVAIELPR
jgi:hypothetical protein